MRQTSSVRLSTLLAAVLATSFLLSAEPTQTETKAPQEAATERARKMMRMLDDVYKTTIVLITDKCVNDEMDFPAGIAAIALFSQIEKKESHQVRLLDVTGVPYDDKNVAMLSAFWELGIEYFCGGKSLAYASSQQRTDPQVVLAKLVDCIDAKQNNDRGT